MRLLTLSTTLLGISLLSPNFAKGEEPTKTSSTPTKEATPIVKKKKGLEAPEIPEGISIADGVKLQEAWLMAEKDPAVIAVLKTHNGEKPKKNKSDKEKGASRDAKAARDEINLVRAKAMQKADPSLNTQLIHDFLQAASERKSKNPSKSAKK